jgi:hypothetical protein
LKTISPSDRQIWAPVATSFDELEPPNMGAVASSFDDLGRQKDENPNIDGNSGASRFSLPTLRVFLFRQVVPPPLTSRSFGPVNAHAKF